MAGIDDGGQLASISYRDALVMSAVQGYLGRDVLPASASPEPIAKLAYAIADAVIRRKRTDENQPPQTQPQEPENNG